MDINEMVIRNSMRGMFNKGYVSICDIDKCLKLAGVVPDRDTYNQLSALHCMSFKDMDRELAAQLPGMVASLFDGLQLSPEDLFVKPTVVVGRTVFDDPPRSQPARQSKSVLRLLGIK